jgi:hypothetical protein
VAPASDGGWPPSLAARADRASSAAVLSARIIAVYGLTDGPGVLTFLVGLTF